MKSHTSAFVPTVKRSVLCALSGLTSVVLFASVGTTSAVAAEDAPDSGISVAQNAAEQNAQAQAQAQAQAGVDPSIGPDEAHRTTNASQNSPKVGVALPVPDESVQAWQKQLTEAPDGADVNLDVEAAFPSTLTRPQVVALTAWMLGDWSTFDGDYENGRVPDEYLKDLLTVPGHKLRHDAAIMFDMMCVDFLEEFGRPLGMTDSYRTYDTQVWLKAVKPNLAATPGTSNHGWGLAVDLRGPEAQWNTTERQWILDNGWKYGWFSPTWAHNGSSRPEPWHFEYMGTTEGAWPEQEETLDRLDELNGDPLQGLFSEDIVKSLEKQKKQVEKQAKAELEKSGVKVPEAVEQAESAYSDAGEPATRDQNRLKKPQRKEEPKGASGKSEQSSDESDRAAGSSPAKRNK